MNNFISELLWFTAGILFVLFLLTVNGKCFADETESCPLECEPYVECLPCDMVKDKDGTMKGHGGWCYINKKEEVSE